MLMHRLVPAALATAIAATLLAAGAAPAAPPGDRYTVTPLVSDVPGMAATTDSNVQNAWGLARSAASPWWFSDNATAEASVYTGDGTISAWRPGSMSALVTVDMSSSDAVFKGLAISNGPSGPRLYAGDFVNGQVDVFDGGWNPVHVPGAFVDPMLPKR